MIKNLSIAAAAVAVAFSIQSASAEDATPWWDHVWGPSAASAQTTVASAETATPWWDHVWGANATKSQNASAAFVARQKADYAAALADIEATLGMVPGFFHLFPEDKLAGIWSVYKAAELSPDATLDGKTRQLIALATAIQSGSPATIYLHTTAALANGASAKEIRETVAVAQIGGKWSEVLTAEHEHTVRADADALFRLGTLEIGRAVPMN